MKNFLIIFFLCAFSFALGWFLKDSLDNKKPDNFVELSLSKPRPFEKYTIENLSASWQTEVRPGKFKIKETLKDEEKFTSLLFEFEFNPNLDGKTTKKITGQINIPKGEEIFPVVLMLRGYIDQKSFKTGDGTRNASAFFAENGFITIAPDFLGYGGSDKEADNIFEARFQAYTTTLSLIKTLEQGSSNPGLFSGPTQLINQLSKHSTIFIWGHSNGGQIALTILEITGGEYPTTLWAPVSKFFPYSVLYYTGDSDDRGKLIRSELANFEKIYNTDLYSLDLYLDKINAPLQIHQGGSDDAVPVSWSDELVTLLKEKGKEITYYKYPQADHNMRPVWNTVILRDVDFFKKGR